MYDYPEENYVIDDIIAETNEGDHFRYDSLKRTYHKETSFYSAYLNINVKDIPKEAERILITFR